MAGTPEQSLVGSSSSHVGSSPKQGFGWVSGGSGRRQWQPTPVLLPEKFHGQRSLVDYSPWTHKESDTTEQLHFDFH